MFDLEEAARPPRIRCARCNKIVDRIVVDDLSYVKGIRITAFCHGSKDEMLLTASFVQNLNPGEYQAIVSGGVEGVAFTAETLAILHGGGDG